MAADHTTAIFLTELILLLFFGRALGELMARFHQPAIFGQLLAGVLLGPSVFGALFPSAHNFVFPTTPALKSMIDAVSQIGILLLLLLTGMETNLSLINRRRRVVISSSLFGILVPFACGFGLAYALPATLIPAPDRQLVTALFVGTALSISSVKIVAMVLMEVGAIRRDLGQLILATAILDDTIAWVLIAVIAGLAASGSVSLLHLGLSIGGTVIFLGLSLAIGRSAVSRIIRWTNDNMTIEVPVVTAILVIMLTMSLMTDLIGVHTALGAFVAGMLVGQSPILTEHIEDELRGFIMAFFSPVFFAVAGLGMDLKTLVDPTLILLTAAVILIASLGKFIGAFVGGRFGGLTARESLTLATGLNARGSTEVIIASIGVSMGVLSAPLYTMIVAMAIVTTMVMPPTLRWMLARVPILEEEAKRLEKEEAEESESVPQMERALVYFDDSPSGRLAATLGGLFAGSRQVLTTVMPVGGGPKGGPEAEHFVEAAAAHAEAAKLTTDKASASDKIPLALEDLIKQRPAGSDDAVESEIAKGYSIAFVGLEDAIEATSGAFQGPLSKLVEAFDGPLAIAIAGGRAIRGGAPLRVLVPAHGTSGTRLATEIAMALAKATGGTVTALHVFDPRDDSQLLRGRGRRQGLAVLIEARRLGRRSNVPVKGITAINARPEAAIQRATRNGDYDLVVVGTSLRQSDNRFLGPRVSAIVRALDCPVLLVAQ